MKWLTARVLMVALLAGCAHRPDTSSPRSSKPVITPDLRPTAHVEMVNNQARFVVLNFGADSIPAPGQVLNVYHRGLKIGEVRVTGPQRDTDTVADILVGDANAGDDAQAQ